MKYLLPLERMLHDHRGAGAAEFALVLPLLVALLFGIIDAGRLLYVTNSAEKATQMGARFAIVTDVMPDKLLTEEYVGDDYCGSDGATTCTEGDFIVNPDALGALRCTSGGCTCETGGNCPSGASIDGAAFTRLVARMQQFRGDITAANVAITFRGSGIGYAGDPTGMDIVPLVTVELTDLTFRPLSLLAIPQFNLPSFKTTLSAESAVGELSN